MLLLVMFLVLVLLTGFILLFGQVQPTVTMLLLLSILIIAHEMGHFWVAKKCGIRVERFGFGLPFGPTWTVGKIGETDICIHAALIGGYVAFPDDDPDSDLPADSPERFENKSVPERFAVAIAGVAVNAFLAWFIMTMTIFYFGAQEADIQVGKVMDGMPAQTAGVMAEDVIIAVNGTKFIDLDLQKRSGYIKNFIENNPGKEVQLTLDRSGELVTVSVLPNPEKGLIGVVMQPTNIRHEPVDFITANEMAVSSLIFITVENFKAFGELLTFQRDPAELGGPIRIVGEGAAAIERNGIEAGLMLAALISMILAVMNLLPIPALDGGHILFLIIEAIKGSPINKELQEKVVTGGFACLLVLMVFIIFNDINNMWINPKPMGPSQELPDDLDDNTEKPHQEATNPETALPETP